MRLRLTLAVLVLDTVLFIMNFGLATVSPMPFHVRAILMVILVGLFALGLVAGLAARKTIAAGSAGVRMVALVMLFFFSPGLAISALILVPTTVALLILALVKPKRERRAPDGL